MKYLISFLTLLLPLFTFAQENTEELTPESSGAIDAPQEITLPICSDIYTLEGITEVKINTPYEYTINTHDEGITASGVIFQVLQESEIITNVQNDSNKLLQIFPRAGNYTVRAEISRESPVCTGSVSLEVQSYNKVITYLNAQDTDDAYGKDFENQFKANNILFEYFPVNEKINSEIFQDYWKYLDESDIIIFGYGDILDTFSQIESLQKIKNIDFSQKRVYIISNYSHAFLSKVLALSVAEIGTKEVSLIDEGQLSRLLNEWSVRKNLEYSDGRILSYEKRGGIFTLSSFLEFLAYSGISYQFLGFLLVLTTIALLFNIFKQVIGLYVFGIYYPILFAIILTILGLRLSASFFFIAFMAVGLVILMGRWIHLLFNAKRALLISMYILLIFIALGLDNLFELDIFTYDAFRNNLIIIPLFASLFIAEKVFQDGGKFFSQGWFFTLVQFAIITGIAYFLLGYQTLQYFLISYPDVIFIIVFLNILVGRYLGLQVFEYMRFSPILRHLNDEEE